MLRLSVAMALPAMRTPLSVNSRACSVGHRITAAAPSAIGEESNRLIGSAIMPAFLKASGVIARRNIAFGLPTALAWALIEKPAKSS